MWYSFRCMTCEHNFDRELPVDDRNNDQTCPECGMSGAVRMCDFQSVTIGIPAGFKTVFSDIHGIPGSPQREQFEKEVKEGKTVYAGPGSRWV